jgi:hypothetical protein
LRLDFRRTEQANEQMHMVRHGEPFIIPSFV